MKDDKLFTVGDICRLAKGRITSEGVRAAMNRGALRCIRTAGGTRLATEEDARRWAAELESKRNGTAA